MADSSGEPSNLSFTDLAGPDSGLASATYRAGVWARGLLGCSAPWFPHPQNGA